MDREVSKVVENGTPLVDLNSLNRVIAVPDVHVHAVVDELVGQLDHVIDRVVIL